VLEVGIVLQVPTPSALPHTWTLKWVYKELGSATFMFFTITFQAFIILPQILKPLVQVKGWTKAH
jgi:hypothetical protein